MNEKLIFKSDRYSNMELFYFILLLALFLYLGIISFSWIYFAIILVIGALSYYYWFHNVFIFEERVEIRKNKLFSNRHQSISLNSCTVFKNYNGPKGANYFALEHRTKNGIDVIGFYVNNREDVKLLINFFTSKGIKVEAKVPLV